MTTHINFLNGSISPFVQNWGVVNIDTSTLGHDSLELTASSNAYEGRASTPSTQAYGSWDIDFKFEDVTSRNFAFGFISQSYNVGSPPINSYSVEISSSNVFKLVKYDSGSNATILINSSWNIDTNQHLIKVIRDPDGTFNLYLDGVLKGTAKDNTITTSTQLYVDLWSGFSAPHVFIDYLDLNPNETIFKGKQYLQASSISSSETFGTSYVGGSGCFLPSCGSAPCCNLVSNKNLFPTSINSTETFGSSHLKYKQYLHSINIQSTETFGISRLKIKQYLKSIGFASSTTFGSPKIKFKQYLHSIGLQSTETFGNAKLIAVQLLKSISIISSESFGLQSKLKYKLKQTSIPSSETFGKSTIFSLFVLLSHCFKKEVDNTTYRNF
jgi:hypothetical protein